MRFVVCILMSVVGAAEPLSGQFNFQFSNGLENQPVLKLVGPNAIQAARTDAGGLRITLPSQRQNPAAVGVKPRFRLRGDFEATLSYELLAATPPPPPNGAGIVLRLKFDSPTPQIVTLTRVRRYGKTQTATDQFGTNLYTHDQNGKLKIDTKMAPASSTQGQLRLARSGETLRFLVSDGAGAAFQEIRILPIGAVEVAFLRAECVTGGKQGSVDGRLIALSVQAEEMPNQPGQLRAKSPGWAKWLWLGIIGSFLGVAVPCFFWLARRRRARRSLLSTEYSREEAARKPPRP